MAKGISIHALRGEGDELAMQMFFEKTISIHALRGEGDIPLANFLNSDNIISIHALRGEGDEE